MESDKKSFNGKIIAESLLSPAVLKLVSIISTKVIDLGENSSTPWLKQWTIHTIKVSEANALLVSAMLAKALEPDRPWYIDFKNDETHYIIYVNKIFCVNRRNGELYKQAREYGKKQGIPVAQLDFK